VEATVWAIPLPHHLGACGPIVCGPVACSCGLTQVLTQPAYMEDHLAALDEDIAAGAVPVPTLPKHKQVSSMYNDSLQALCNLLHLVLDTLLQPIHA